MSHKYLKPDIVNGYYQVTLSINRKPFRIKVHRLVALLFISNPNPGKYNQINHIDGNKANNSCSNLEWCDAYMNNKHARDTNLNNVIKSNHDRWKNKDFRKRTSEKISASLKRIGCSKWKNNPRFRYLITYNSQEITRTQLRNILHISQSWADALIRRAANGENIKCFSEHNIQVIDIKKS